MSAASRATSASPAGGPAARAATPLLGRIALRWRLSLAIGLLLSAALAVAALVAVHSARVAVEREVGTSLRTARASLGLTLSLLDGRDEATIERTLQDWVAGYTGARHLCVALGRAQESRCSDAMPGGVPAWFAGDAESQEPIVRHEVTLPGSARVLHLLLRADPRDELREAWVDVRSFLWLIAGLAFAVNLCAFLIISYGLRPLQAQARAQLRDLHVRHLELQEEERGMVARELHDEIGQHVTAIEMEAIRIGRLAPQEQVRREARLQQLRQSVARIHQVSRRLVQRLRPPSIDRLGLAGALDGMFDRWREDHPEIGLTAEIDPRCDRLGATRALHLYRIAQESLSNAARHAQAGRVWVALRIQGGEIVLRVADDGRGFDVGAAPRAGGYGLDGMRERTEALQGRFELRSRPGAGTCIEARIPPGMPVPAGCASLPRPTDRSRPAPS